MAETFALARPWVLALLALVPLWILWRLRQRRRSAVPFAPLQYAAPGGGPNRALLLRLAAAAAPGVEALFLAALIMGLAAPYRETRLELIEDEGIDVLLVLDVSLSMLAEDIPPNRLEALNRVAGDFIARAGGHRIGILVFAGDVYVQTPLTTDHRSLLELLDGVSVYTLAQSASGGTAVGDALLVAGRRLAASRVEGRDQAVILITDGQSNLGLEPELAARWVAQQGIRLDAIGVGGTEPVEVVFEGERVGGENAYLAVLDDAQLQAMTRAAGGRWWRATDAGALEEIFAELSRLQSAPLERRTAVTRRSYANLLAVAAMVLFAAHLGLAGRVLRRPLR
jgi:Ca-activated chloride channel family protein